MACSMRCSVARLREEGGGFKNSMVAACASEPEIILRRPEGWCEGELPVPPDPDLPHQISQAVPVTGVLVSAPLQTAKAVPQNMGLTRLG